MLLGRMKSFYYIILYNIVHKYFIFPIEQINILIGKLIINSVLSCFCSKLLNYTKQLRVIQGKSRSLA